MHLGNLMARQENNDKKTNVRMGKSFHSVKCYLNIGGNSDGESIDR